MNQKTSQKLFSLIEKYWPILLLLLAVVYSLAINSDLFNASVLCSGVLCVALVANGSIWNYPIGMYNTLAYAYISFSNNLFGEFYLYILFFLPTNIVGYFVWSKKSNKGIIKSRFLSNKQRLITTLVLVFAIIGLGLLLENIPQQNNPYMDSFVTILSIAATVLMIGRYSEQWVLYILLNTVCILLWVFRHLDGSSEALSMIGMWSIFWINACFGYYMWFKKLNKKVEE